MKILHTADWHIGKRLHSYSLDEDFDRFIDWLCQYMSQEDIDVLLVSGDCFDLANPSSTSRNQYFESLVKLRKSVKHIIITGGNHDSPSVLNAPQKVLKALDIHVVGGLPQDISEAIIPLRDKNDKITTVVAAIPFLRNPDIRRKETVLRTSEERIEALQNGIVEVFDRAAEECKTKYPDVPAIAMGHLYAAGIEESDSERDIQIGNQAAVKASSFNSFFKYVALGHIHKPQRVSSNQPVFYSGSPLPLSFSERKDEKRILILDTQQSFEPQSVSVPSFRKLIKIKGNLETIQTKIDTLPENDAGLKNLLEIELIEQEYQSKLLLDLEEIVANFDKPGYEIVKHRANFDNQLQGLAPTFGEEINLEELKPKKVFEERLDREDFTDEERRELIDTFAELLEEMNSQTT